MNPKRELNFSNVTMYFDGEEIGKLNSVSASVKIEDTNESQSHFNFSKSFECTFENVAIHSELILGRELFHIKQVLKYVKHSKKKASAVKRYLELVKKIQKH